MGVTPLRNALTLAASDPSGSVTRIYRKVFQGGLTRGWVGGAYPAVVSCPQFLCMGPIYHLFASIGGTPAGVIAAAAAESLCTFSAETLGAQMATDASSPGSIKDFQPLWRPWGPGLVLQLTRNLISVSGMRIFGSAC